MVFRRALARTERGSSLIEVLISLVLVAVTMLGLLGLQLRTLSLQKDSLDRRNAAILVAAFGDRVAGNFSGFSSLRYNALSMGVADSPPPPPPPCANVNACRVDEISARDWSSFQIDVRNRLPNGVAFVTTPPDLTRIEVTLGWLDPQRFSEPLADPACNAVGISDVRFRCYFANVFP